MAIPALLMAATRIGSAMGAGAAAGEAAGATAGAMSAGRAVAQLGQACGQLSHTAQHSARMVVGLAAKLSDEFVKSLTFVVDALGQVAAPVERIVRVANPAIADAFGRAMSDAYGVVGRMLIPVMESFVGVARKVGAVMAGLEPVVQPAIDSISKLVDQFGDTVVTVLTEHAPTFELFADVLGKVVDRVTTVVHALTKLWENLYFGSQVLRFFGFGGRFDPNASAVGAAARHAQFVQPKAIADEAIKNSVMQGLGQKRAKTLDDVVDPLEKIYTFLQRRWGQVEAFKRGATDGAGVSRDDVRDFAAGIQQGALDRFRIARPNR